MATRGNGFPQHVCTVLAWRRNEPSQQQDYLRHSIRIPVKPETVGDHIRLRRLNLKMLQKDVALRLGVETTCIHNWEANTGTPRPQYFPAIIAFLGYNPLPPPKTWADRLVRGRTAQGLSQKSFAKQLQVDPSTLARWERGEREPEGEFAAKGGRLLSTGREAPLRARRQGKTCSRPVDVGAT